MDGKAQERERGDRKSFTGGPASSLHSLQKETIMRIHAAKDSRLSREYIVKMQASARSRKRVRREGWWKMGKHIFYALQDCGKSLEARKESRIKGFVIRKCGKYGDTCESG